MSRLLRSCLLLIPLLLFAAEVTPPPQPVEPVHLGIIPDTNAGLLDETRGVVVKEVEPGNCAADMGLQPGDIITHFNSQPILRVDDLKRALAASRIGNQAVITVKRAQQVLDLTGALRGKFRPAALEEPRRELERLSQAAVRAGAADPNNLNANLRRLTSALNELPDRIEEAAKEFKKVYPKGEFTLNIELRISTDITKDPATAIKLGEEGEIPAILGGGEDGEGDEEPEPEAPVGPEQPKIIEPDTP
jgi:hypothetical protein